MPATLIHIVDDSYHISVANSGISYEFQGETLDAQQFAIQQMANGLRNGLVVDGGEFVEAGGLEPEMLTQQLFESTDMLLIGDQAVYGTVGEAMLMEDLEEVGMAILSFFGLL